MKYRLTHLGGRGFDCVGSIHPALPVGPRSALVILEAATGYPGDLATVSTTGRCRHLTAGQVVETETAVVVFPGRDRIEHIGMDATVRSELPTWVFWTVK